MWVWILLLAALVKIPLAGLMLWMPFRYDEAADARPDMPDSSEEDGGSKALPGGPTDPHPRAAASAAPAARPARLSLSAAPPRVRTPRTPRDRCAPHWRDGAADSRS